MAIERPGTLQAEEAAMPEYIPSPWLWVRDQF
jgi:hypothetical protein